MCELETPRHEPVFHTRDANSIRANIEEIKVKQFALTFVYGEGTGKCTSYGVMICGHLAASPPAQASGHANAQDTATDARSV